MTISEEIIKILSELGNMLGITIDWTSENIIPYLQELLSKYASYTTWNGIAGCFLGLVLIITGIFFGIKLKKIFETNNDEFLFGIFLTFIIFSSIIGLIVLGCNIVNIITALTFPEKLILDELPKLIK